MSEEGWDRQLEALFSSSVPAGDPDQGPALADLQLERGVDLERLIMPPELDTTRPTTLNALLAVSMVGEALAVVVLIFTLFRIVPRPLPDARLYFASIAFVGVTLVLLFVQWQLAKRLAQIEGLTNKRNQQLGQAVATIQRYRQELRLANQAAYRGEANLKFLSRIGRLAAEGFAVHEFAERLVRHIGRQFDPAFIAFFSLDPQHREARLLAVAGEADREAVADLEELFVSDSASLRQAIHQRRPYTVEDVAAVRQSQGLAADDRLLVADAGSAILVPVVARDQVLGSITVQRLEVDAFDQQDAALLTSTADLVASAMANAPS
jgi:hypothetical protein